MSKKILIVDDEEEIREMLARHFEILGYETRTAENGLSALQLMAKEYVDITISDIQMPELNGVDFLRQVRREYPMVRVIMITGYVTLENALACMRLGADTCIFKPFRSMAELENAVQKAVFTLEHWEQKFRELKGMKPSLNREKNRG